MRVRLGLRGAQAQAGTEGMCRPFQKGGDWMRYRKFIALGAVAAACGAFGGAPALASQPSSAHRAVVAAAHPGHAVVVPNILNGTGCAAPNICKLEDGAGQVVLFSGADAEFMTPVLGHVNQTANCWPFSDCRFDTLYSGHEVIQFVVQGFISSDGDAICLQTDSVHSGVVFADCGDHNAGTYWMTLPGGSHGVCAAGFWLVNVGITNHYPVYPYGYAMFVNTNNLIYVQSHRPIGDDDQWCVIPG